MGTTFYWMEDFRAGDESDRHIGKSSAAGPYCWDCNISLCVDLDLLHSDKGRFMKFCPMCKKGVVKDFIGEGGTGLQLGFVKGFIKNEGIGSCCSFSWAQDKDSVTELCSIHYNNTIMQDEYENEYSGKYFLEYLERNCPIDISNFVGVDFS